MISARLFLVMVSVSCFALGCNKTFCNGSIGCGLFDLEKCATVPGCTPGPACEVRTNHPQSCDATDEASCVAPRCSWIDNACVPFCWVQCLGTPDIPSCGHYSVAMCPADLGCRVETSNGFPDN